MNRSETLHKLRPKLHFEIEAKTELEKFQNQTLRPILKFQHDLTLEHLHASRFKLDKYKIESKTFHAALKKFMSNDLSFRNILIGTICGLMSIEEFQFYSNHKAELTKRMLSMQLQRYMDTFFKNSNE